MNRKLILITSFFIIIEIILGLSIQFTHQTLHIVLCYSSVVLACTFSFIFLKKDSFLTQLGLVFTVFADLFLVVITPMLQIPAMICFSITQICYFLRLYLNEKSKKENLIHIITRITTSILIIILTIIILKEKTDFLSILSTFYYTNLILNIIFAFRKTNKSILFSIGLLLFSLCDLQIGIAILNDSYINVSNNIILKFLIDPPFNFAWFFYVPSQTLIALSVINDKTSTN